jgi:NAD(P)-dependent dehydrogenase (short-subunit alcohol dehydrogenase family)
MSDGVQYPDLTGRVAVVTGGSRGLGREMVLAFAACGADVVVASRKLASCQELASEVEQRWGRQGVAAAYHAASWTDADALCELVYERLGRCDILVNNAGMSPLYPSLPEVSEDLFDKVVGVNLKGPFRLSSLIGARMAEDAGGSIINVSSIAATRPRAGEVVYAAAKAGVEVMTIGLAQAYGPKVRCNVLRPGPFLTDISKAWDLESFTERARRTFPLGRGGDPSEIVGAALYLASDLSSFTTAAVITVDGGATYQSQ